MSTYNETLLAPFGAGKNGLGTAVGYTIYDYLGNTRVARTTTGVSEIKDAGGSGVGTYTAIVLLDTFWLPARVHWDATGQSGLSYDTIIGQQFAEIEGANTRQPPSIPTGFSISAGSDGQASISWSANPESNIMRYDVIRTSDLRVIFSGTGTSCRDSGLHPGVTATYAVRSVNTFGLPSTSTANISFTVATGGAYADPTWIGSQAPVITPPPNWIGPPAY